MARSPVSPPSPAAHIRLPGSVEDLLEQICHRHSVAPPDIMARRRLAALAEADAVHMLQLIAASPKVNNLSSYIVYMAKNSSPSPARNSESILKYTTKISVLSPTRNDETARLSGLPPASRIASNRGVSVVRSLSNEMREAEQVIPQMAAFHTVRQTDLASPQNLLPQMAAFHTARQTELASPQRAAFDSMQPTELVRPQMVALGKLDFMKAFMILSYIGRSRLEDTISVNLIDELKSLNMVSFEEKIWGLFGHRLIPLSDRRKNLESDPSKTYVYHCHVASDGVCTFKGPYIDVKRTHLQRVLGDDNILLVKFAEEVTNVKSSKLSFGTSNVYPRIAKEGILVGLRRYHFFVFKDGGKEEKKQSPISSSVKCYFVRTESSWAMDLEKPYILANKQINEARSMFMHVHTTSSLPKYMSRFSLILSKTIKFDVDLAHVHIKEIEDIPCTDERGQIIYNEDGETMIHTDGTGFISEDLAKQCPGNICKGKMQSRSGGSEVLEPPTLKSGPPLLIQFRLFNNGCAVKGTLLVNKQLPSKTICIRPSMIKVNAAPPSADIQYCNSLEIVATSNQPKRAYLSRFLIALLHYGGVPKEFFLELLINVLDDAQNARYNKRSALRVALSYGDMDDFIVSRMILCGIPLDEPFLQSRLLFFMSQEWKGLKGGKIPISESYNLMGTVDPTGTLKSNEVCIILDNGHVSGDVLVYKAPGLHFGDIHLLRAIYVKDLETIVGNAKYAIFFPTKGPRSLADEMANSDFDGDMYWVSRNPQLLKYFRASEPWARPASKEKIHQTKPSEYSNIELERQLFQDFLKNRFNPSYAMGIASDSWLAFMDRLLTLGDECIEEKQCLRSKMLQLINIYYDALDAPKTGLKVQVPDDLRCEKYPHFMEKKPFRETSVSYRSTSILGLIYDKVCSYQTDDLPSSGREIWELVCFTKEVPQSCFRKWEELYGQYRDEMSDAMTLEKESKSPMADKIIQKCKWELYKAEEFEESPRSRKDIFDEAVAIYQVTYNYAKRCGDAKKCGFAWKVAGHVLCTMFAQEQSMNSPILCSSSVLREILG